MSFMLRGAITALALVASATSAEAAPCYGRASGANQLEPSSPLTLQAVLNEVRRASPEVRAAGLEVHALGAEADQAARRLNPSILVELENFSGSGALSGFDQTETTIAVEQTFRLGDKRGLNERAARARQALASAECAVVLREAELQAALLFSDLLAAEDLQKLTQQTAALSERLAATVERRVEAGAAAPPELARARADAATIRANAAGIAAEIEARRYALALLWGEANPQFGSAVASTDVLDDALDDGPAENPRLDAASAGLRAREAETALARSAALPDVTVSAGFRRFEESGDEAFIAGLSVPLPLFDRGRDTARASAFRADAAALDRQFVEQRLLSEQRSAAAARRAAQARLDILSQDALPAAEEAYAAAERGYEVGRFDLTTTLNARAVLLQTQVAVIEAERALLAEDLRLRALIGATPFDGGLQ
ncbi:MAG: TolC family protein [Pseudomonadota bacterium]